MSNALPRLMWTKEEDAALLEQANHLKHRKWAEVAKYVELTVRRRPLTAKQVRERWCNHLRPELRHGVLSACEMSLLLREHSRHGPKWATIASTAFYGMRSDLSLKNAMNAYIARASLAERRRIASEKKKHDPSPVSKQQGDSKPLVCGVVEPCSAVKKKRRRPRPKAVTPLRCDCFDEFLDGLFVETAKVERSGLNTKVVEKVVFPTLQKSHRVRRALFSRPIRSEWLTWKE